MTALSVTKNYADASILTQAHLDTAYTSVETVVNGLLESENNIDFAGNIRFNKNGNDYLNWNDTDDKLDLYVDGTAVWEIEETGTTVILRTLVSNDDFIFAVNDGGVDTTAITIAGATANVTIAKDLIITGALTPNGSFLVTSPHITTGIQDANGLEIIDFTATGSATTQVVITNATTGIGGPTIGSAGETNVNLNINASGTGIIQFLQAGIGQVVALSDGANIATDASLGNTFTVTLTDNRILDNPTNPTNGQRAVWQVSQDAGGTNTLAYGNAFRFGDDITDAVLGTTGNDMDILGCIYDGADSKWDVVLFLKGFPA